MAVLRFFNMLALFLIGVGLVAMTTASPITIAASNDVSAAAKSYLAVDSPVAMLNKREEAKQCFWVCIHTYCTRQCIGDDVVAALKANNALVIDEAEMKPDTTISVTSSHAQLGNPFIYHCDWTSGMCWTDPVLQAKAGTDKQMDEIPDIPTKDCREICSTDESLCGLICDTDEKMDEKTDVEKADVSTEQVTCHWECYFGQCWAVCVPWKAAGSAQGDVGVADVTCRWECYFGQCYACCVPWNMGDAVEKRDDPTRPCHERCDDDRCWIVCPRPPIE